MIRKTSSKLWMCVMFMLFTIASAQAQSLNSNWSNDLNNSLKEFLTCEGNSKERTECTHFMGESLATVYKINDFSKSGKYMTTSEITEFVKNSTKWKMIGPSYDQAALIKAQELANAKKAVVAVFKNAEGIGHVVLITPGELQTSGSWGLRVPNSASFFQTEPSKSYVGKGLSFAFSRVMMKDVALYVREY